MNCVPIDMLPTQGPLLPTQGPLLPTQGPLLPTQGPLLPTLCTLLPTQGPLLPTGSIAPYTGSIAPYTGSIAPYTGSIAPYTGSIAPYTGSIAPYTGSIAPYTGSIAPYTGSIAPYTGSIAPYTGSIAPYTGSIAPYTGSIAPYTVSIAPYTGSIAPYTGSIAPYIGSIAPYSLNPRKFTLFRKHSFMDLRWATSSRTDECDIIYLCKYIQFEFTSCTLQCTLNGIYTFASNWNHGGISCDVHFAGHLRSNRTNIWSDGVTYEICRAGGREDWNWEPLSYWNERFWHSCMYKNMNLRNMHCSRTALMKPNCILFSNLLFYT